MNQDSSLSGTYFILPDMGTNSIFKRSSSIAHWFVEGFEPAHPVESVVAKTSAQTVWSSPNLVPPGKDLRELAMFNWLNSYISPGGRVPDKLPSKIGKAWPSITKFRHLQSRSHTIIGQNSSIRTNREVSPVIPLRNRAVLVDARMFSLSKHRWIPTIGRIWWDDLTIKLYVRLH